MRAHETAKKLRAKLPAPPAQHEDIVKGVGWTFGPAIRKTRDQAEADLGPLLLADGEPSGLPEDPSEPPLSRSHRRSDPTQSIGAASPAQ